MNKYDVGGVYTISVFGEVEANSEEEAKKLFAKRVEKSIEVGVDWVEEVSCDAKLLHDYTFKLEQVLSNCNYSQKAAERPKLIASGQPNDDFNYIELYSAKLTDGHYIVFMVIGEDVFIPIMQNGHWLMVEDEDDLDNDLSRVFKAYWVDKRCEVSTFTVSGAKLSIYNKKATVISRTALGNRIEYILKKLDKKALIVAHSTSTGLDLYDPDDKDVTYTAQYSSSFDEVPDTLTMIKSII